MPDSRVRWLLVTAIAPIAWGSTYFVTRHLLPADAALWGAVIRCLPAGLLVLLIARELPRGSWWWRSLVLGTLTVGGLNVLVYIAAQRLPSSLAATLMSASAGVMILMSWAIQHARPTLAAVLGALIGIAGVVLMLGPTASGIDWWGVAASLGAMLSSSLGFVLTARWNDGRVGALPMTAWQLIAGALVVLPAALVVEGAPPALDPPAIAGFVYITLIATALAYAAWFAGLARLPAASVGLIGLLNPVTGVALGLALGGEHLAPVAWVGLALVLGGIALGALAPHRAAASDAALTPRDAPPARG